MFISYIHNRRWIDFNSILVPLGSLGFFNLAAYHTAASFIATDHVLVPVYHWPQIVCFLFTSLFGSIVGLSFGQVGFTYLLVFLFTLLCFDTLHMILRLFQDLLLGTHTQGGSWFGCCAHIVALDITGLLFLLLALRFGSTRRLQFFNMFLQLCLVVSLWSYRLRCLFFSLALLFPTLLALLQLGLVCGIVLLWTLSALLLYFMNSAIFNTEGDNRSLKEEKN